MARNPVSRLMNWSSALIATSGRSPGGQREPPQQLLNELA
jgi:hypothetical protein